MELGVKRPETLSGICRNVALSSKRTQTYTGGKNPFTQPRPQTQATTQSLMKVSRTDKEGKQGSIYMTHSGSAFNAMNESPISYPDQV